MGSSDLRLPTSDPVVVRGEARSARSPVSVSRHCGVQSTRLAGHAACNGLRDTRSHWSVFRATLAVGAILVRLPQATHDVGNERRRGMAKDVSSKPSAGQKPMVRIAYCTS